MDWTEIATRSDLAALQAATKSDLAALQAATRSDLRELELRLTSHLDRALRTQTQWVFGAVVLLALTMIVGLLVTAA